MFFNNYKNLKNNEIYLLTFLFLFSFLIRIPSIFIYGDSGLENEWRLLVSYLVNYGKLYSILPSLSPAFSHTYVPGSAPTTYNPHLFILRFFYFAFFSFIHHPLDQTLDPIHRPTHPTSHFRSSMQTSSFKFCSFSIFFSFHIFGSSQESNMFYW